MRPRTVLATLVAIALLATGCSTRDSTEEVGAGAEAETSAATTTGAGDFGDLKNVCQSGKASGSSAQGVTDSSIQVGVFSDVGFTKNPEFVNAARVFTEWCNAAGGINGRKLVAETRDSKLFEVRQRMLQSCKEDFAIVGGGSAFDALGVNDRLKCLLPAFPAQVVQQENQGSDLQVTQFGGPSYDVYNGYFNWLLKEAYPGSAGSVGMISGDSPTVKVVVGKLKESVKAAGGTLAYNDLYPPTGVADWTPYAQSIKSKGIKGLLFVGDFRSLASLEQVLTNIDYKLDWIDANSNAYNPAFLQLAAKSLATQNNFADLSGVYPIEKASDNAATQQVVDIFVKHKAATSQVTLPALNAFAAWLLFAKSAASCGDDLTRKCVHEAATKETAWTGGGLHAPLDLTSRDNPAPCFNVEKATASGWEPADFKPTEGAYRCDVAARKFTGDFGKSVTLSDVGKSMSDLK